MAKTVIGSLKLRIPAGRATAGPPVGSTLGQWGLNMMDFINPFNEKTKDMMGKDVIVHMKIYDDRTFDWESLGQPVDDMIREKIGIKKGSGRPHDEKVGKLTQKQLEEIAEVKMGHLNANDIKAAAKVIGGTARSMGVEVEGVKAGTYEAKPVYEEEPAPEAPAEGEAEATEGEAKGEEK